VTLVLEANVPHELERRRRAVSEAWSLRDELVLVGAGTRIPMPGRADRTYPFRVHSEYLYLTDRERPGGVLAFDPLEGRVDFVAPVTRDDRLWEGAPAGDPEGASVGALEGWLEARNRRPTACLGAPVNGIRSDAPLEASTRAALNHIRRQKDELELSRMRAAERATSAGFAAVAQLLEPGRTEREVQIELEAGFFRQGADFLAFDTIVGGGPNSAVLQPPPSVRPFGDGELVLIDAGAEVRGYASDITRTYPASGPFTPEQAELYAIVGGQSRRDRALPSRHRVEGCPSRRRAHDRRRPRCVRPAERGARAARRKRGGARLLPARDRAHGGARHSRRRRGAARPPAAAGRLPAPARRPPAPTGLHDDDRAGRLPRAGAPGRPRSARAPSLFRRPGPRRALGFGGIRIEDDVLVTEDGYEVLTADVPVFN